MEYQVRKVSTKAQAEMPGMAWFGASHTLWAGDKVTILGRSFEVGIDVSVGAQRVALNSETRAALGLKIDDVVIPEFE